MRQYLLLVALLGVAHSRATETHTPEADVRDALGIQRNGLDVISDSGTVQYNTLNPNDGTYEFGYDTGLSPHQSFREESRSADGGVRGVYGYVDSGVLRITQYVADSKGYRCRQTVRYLVRPGRARFLDDDVAAESAPSSSWVPGPQTGAQSTHPQPARVMGKKVDGHYKDFTSVPAIGGTAAVWAWNSAHAAELREDEIPNLGTQKTFGQRILEGFRKGQRMPTPQGDVLLAQL